MWKDDDLIFNDFRFSIFPLSSESRFLPYTSLTSFILEVSQLLQVFHLQPTDLLKRRAEKLNNLLHAQSIRRRSNSYNFGGELDFDYNKSSKIRRELYSVHYRGGNRAHYNS